MDTIETVLLACVAVLSVVGAAPHLFQWIRRTPTLSIIKASVERQSSDKLGYHVHLEVENQKKWWKRNGDASNVVGEYYMIDKDGFQRGFVSGQLVSPYLLAGTKAMKDIEGFHVLSRDGNPYSIVFRVTCNESTGAKQLISYEVPI